MRSRLLLLAAVAAALTEAGLFYVTATGNGSTQVDFVPLAQIEAAVP